MKRLVPKQYIHRNLEEDFLANFENEKILVLYGPRQVGKSSLVAYSVTKFLRMKPDYDLFTFNLDRKMMEFSDPEAFISYILALKKHPQGKTLVVIDEAQRMKNIGLFIKYIYDNSFDFICKRVSSDDNLCT